MRARTCLVGCLMLAAAGCDVPEKPAAVPVLRTEMPAAVRDKDTISAAPEHFDRVRAEQFENEEDRLRRRDRHN